jgi:hypothetical protein
MSVDLIALYICISRRSHLMAAEYMSGLGLHYPVMGPIEYDPFMHLEQMMEPDPVSEMASVLSIPKMLHSIQNQMFLFEFVQNF